MIHEELAPHGFTVVAVALDTAGEGAAQAFAETSSLADVPPPLQRIMGWDDGLWQAASRPTYPSLLDRNHLVARLYNITNVPTAVWIDEAGHVVRPPEHAGAYDMLRHIDMETFEVPDAIADEGRAARGEYLDALRDWVRNGAKSRFVLSPDAVAARVRGPSRQESEAVAQFQIGAWHVGRGDLDAARAFFAEAVRLHPEAWTLIRQQIATSGPEAFGEIAVSPEYLEAVVKLGDRPYYAPFQP